MNKELESSRTHAYILKQPYGSRSYYYLCRHPLRTDSNCEVVTSFHSLPALEGEHKRLVRHDNLLHTIWCGAVFITAAVAIASITAVAVLRLW